MRIDTSKGKKPTTIEATYSAWAEWDLTELEGYDDIVWQDVEDIWIKYTMAEIHMKDGTVHELGMSEPSVDAKWPIVIKVFDENYKVLGEVSE